MSKNIVLSNRSRTSLEGVKSKCAMKTWKQELVTFWTVKGKIMRKARWEKDLESRKRVFTKRERLTCIKGLWEDSAEKEKLNVQEVKAKLQVSVVPKKVGREGIQKQIQEVAFNDALTRRKQGR